MTTATGRGGEDGIIDVLGLTFVEFTVQELWFLHDLVRHDKDAVSDKKWPVVSTGLNGQIALAIIACEDGGLKSYTLPLDTGNLLLLDYHVRRDMKTPEGANGAEILLKVFRARRDAAYGPTTGGGDTSYKEALGEKTREAAAEAADEAIAEEEAKDADTDQDPDEGADEGAA